MSRGAARHVLNGLLGHHQKIVAVTSAQLALRLLPTSPLCQGCRSLALRRLIKRRCFGSRGISKQHLEA
eukprot:CAMPEP_0206428472 /NCGR_PEP_ID=MMETSP0324_2-20121206/5686_1 /ASSEMBLY_ACC=CAM_ASM_000836 /TAXON_ID=2866 /ORGANISM="Crypthecodinium cohnii, Strain Seligo" /LENGTH=68 /DNA_ID=CAMNT_0053894009 /DNA_START=87 /DNA_END=293 /DNA_ORIENTATION=+